jgi:hypothetical protein
MRIRVPWPRELVIQALDPLTFVRADLRSLKSGGLSKPSISHLNCPVAMLPRVE